MQEDIESLNEENNKLDKVKKHFNTHWKKYAVSGGLVLTAGVTFVVTKRIYAQLIPINGTTTIVTKASIKDNGAFYNVFNIYPPGFKQEGLSWMVGCRETGQVFKSQKHAADVLGISASHLSEHLNGLRDHVKGLHFDRLGVAA